MASYGRQAIASTGQPVRVSFDGNPMWKAGGVTLDWNTVAPVAVDTVLADGITIPAGGRGLALGTVLQEIGATGKYGTMTPAMTATTLNNGGTSAIGAATATLTAVTNIQPGDFLLIDTSTQAETAQVASIAGNVVTFVSPLTKTHNDGVAVAKPDDGRQALVQGKTYVLDSSVIQTPRLALFSGATDHPAVFYGGLVWSARLRVGGANQPTLAQLLTACPMLQPADL